MDNKIIIAAIITGIATGIVAPFCKSVFDKIFAAYNPDPRKITSGIKYWTLVILRYTVLFGVFIYIFQSRETVDKYFVLALCTSFSLLLMTIFFEFTYVIFFSPKSLIRLMLSQIENFKDNAISALKLIDEIKTKEEQQGT